MKVTLDGRALREALAFAARFVCTDDYRPTLGAVCVELTEIGVWLAATDMYALGWTWVRARNAAIDTEPADPTERVETRIAVNPRLLHAAIDGEVVDLQLDGDQLGVASGIHAVWIKAETAKTSTGDGATYPDWRKYADPDTWPSNTGGDSFGLDPVKLIDVCRAFTAPEYLVVDEFGEGEDVWHVHDNPLIIAPPVAGHPCGRISQRGRHRWAVLMGIRFTS